MLAHAVAALAPDGRVVYATCSSEPEENEDVVRAVAADLDLEVRDARAAHPALPGAVIDADGALRTTPPAHELDAFYGVVLQRRRQL